jgi:hypothetical protein
MHVCTFLFETLFLFAILSQERISEWYAIPIRVLLLLLLICPCSSSCMRLVRPRILSTRHNGEGRSVIRIVNLTTQRQTRKGNFDYIYAFFERRKLNEYIKVIPRLSIGAHVSCDELLNILGWNMLLAWDMRQTSCAKSISVWNYAMRLNIMKFLQTA